MLPIIYPKSLCRHHSNSERHRSPLSLTDNLATPISSSATHSSLSCYLSSCPGTSCSSASLCLILGLSSFVCCQCILLKPCFGSLWHCSTSSTAGCFSAPSVTPWSIPSRPCSGIGRLSLRHLYRKSALARNRRHLLSPPQHHPSSTWASLSFLLRYISYAPSSPSTSPLYYIHIHCNPPAPCRSAVYPILSLFSLLHLAYSNNNLYTYTKASSLLNVLLAHLAPPSAIHAPTSSCAGTDLRANALRSVASSASRWRTAATSSCVGLGLVIA